MAGGQAVDANGYRFMAKPLSFWRRFFRDFLPYWQASKPAFVLMVQRTGPPATKVQPLNWFVRFGTGDFTGGQETIPALQTGNSVNFIVGGKLLGYTGDTLLVIPTNLDAAIPSQYHTVYSFHTTPKVWVFLALVAGVLAGAFAGLFQWVLTL